MSSRTKFFNSHPQDGALAEIPEGRPCWALTAKIEKGTADGVLVLDMTHACDVLRVHGDQLSPTLQAQMNGFGVSKEKAYTETARDRHGVIPQQAQEARRLTPRECERLQGFPDDWTLITFHNRPAADGQRYRANGNS